jgi:glycosyltransferase involved in cell wall biosynthesis
MRVALVVTGGLDRSGTERVIPALVWLIERLARAHDVHAFVLRHLARPASYDLRGARVHDLGRPHGLARQYRALVRALAAHGRFDVVHAYWALPAGLVAAAAGRRLGVPAVVTLDSGELVAIPEIGYGLQQAWRQRQAVRAATALAARVTVCSGYMQRLASSLRIRAEVVPIGVDAGRFDRSRPSEGPPWRLLQVASLNPVKDQPTLLRAFRRIADRVDARLDIAGEDTLGGAVERLAQRLEIADRVVFHGWLPTERIAALYREAHLAIVSSRHEAAGVTALEAAASGVPLVGTRVGYLADWTPDRAVTVPTGDPAALADAVCGLLADEAHRRRLAAAAREWTLEHDADWTAAAFDDLYGRVTRERLNER